MQFPETARLLFRAHEARDEEYFVQMQTDPEVRRYVGGRAWGHEEAVRRFREQYLGKPLDATNLCATELKANGRYIGFCGIRMDGAKSAHLGYYLARPYWGLGLATEAAGAFIDLAFLDLGLDELRADADDGHAASHRILNKFGFALVRTEELPGRTINHYRLAGPLRSK